MRGEILRNGGGVNLYQKKKKKKKGCRLLRGREGKRGGILKKTVIVQVFVSFEWILRMALKGGRHLENINILAAVTGPKF